MESPLSNRYPILFPWDLPETVHGTAVVFDIVAASFNIIYLTEHAKNIYVTTKQNVEAALTLLPEANLIGEVDDPTLGKRLEPLFLAPNSPTEILNTDVDDKTILLITNNGTHTISEAIEKGADRVLVGHYANIHALCNLLSSPPQTVTLIPSGGREDVYADDRNLREDLFCAEAVRDILTGTSPDFESLIRKTLSNLPVQYAKSGMPQQTTLDILFTSLDKHPTVPRCRLLSNGLIHIEAIPSFPKTT